MKRRFRLSPADRWLAAVAALVIATTLVLAAGFRSGYHPIPRQSLCLSRVLFDKPCPGCGLTRSFISLGSGDVKRAVEFNPLGPVLFGAICVLLLSRIAKLVTGPRKGWLALDVFVSLATLGAMALRTIAFYVR